MSELWEGSILHKRHINEFLHTGFASSGRAAGIGITYDRYDDESGNHWSNSHKVRVKMPSDSLSEEERTALNGEVIVYKNGERL